MKRILVTGGNGRFAQVLKNKKSNFKFIFRNKKQLNILSKISIINNIKRFKPNYILHLAGLSRPMNVHNKDIKRIIDLNIIGTANITKACEEKKIKLIYFSTNYVYPGIKGNYKETDGLLPVNNYAWSKLGGEASVQLYDNSLILRVCMTEKPFVHKFAFSNVKTSFTYHENVAKILFKLLNKKGVLNIGGPASFIYDFVKKENKKIVKKKLGKNENIGLPFDSSIDLSKLMKIIK